MRIVCQQQRTAEWYAARIGKVTGSELHKALHFVEKGSKVRGDKRWESAADREAYKKKLRAEILAPGYIVENYVSPFMDEGSELEPLARVRYMMETQEDVTLTGFVLHPTMDRFGCSPDGYSENGCQELKCPKPETHLGYLETGQIPDAYIDQVDAEILCCDKEWCDFVSFCPHIADYRLQYFCVRRYRDEARFRAIEEGVTLFLEEVLGEIDRLKRIPLVEQLREAVEHDAAMGL